MMSGSKISGSCACGKISFTSNHIPEKTSNCYCVQCSKCAGGPCLSFADFPVSEITWKTKPTIWKNSDIAERGFCPTCGASLTMLYYMKPDIIGITLSSIDKGVECVPPPQRHIFSDEKGPWVELPNDGKERVTGFGSDGFGERLKLWQDQKQTGA